MRWLRDGLGSIAQAGDVEQLAASVPDNGGVYFVPALLRAVRSPLAKRRAGHDRRADRVRERRALARATLEGVAWQVRDVLDGAVAATGTPSRSCVSTAG